LYYHRRVWWWCASVLDSKGKLVTTLPESAFKVLENNVEQTIKIFRREDIPVSMGIVIDNSGSMRDKRAKVAAASLDLVKASNPQDEVFIVNFNDDAYLDQPFTNDLKKLETALERIDPAAAPPCATPQQVHRLAERWVRARKTRRRWWW
jgi:VWFA-related protein